MDEKSLYSKNFPMEQIIKLANSPAGKQLMTILHQQDSETIQKAMDSAASGNYAQAKEAIASLLTDPNIKALLKQIGE